MKNIEIRIINKKDYCEIGQLYAILNKENDIHINGSVALGKVPQNVERIKVHSNLCNAEGSILYTIESYKNFNPEMGDYYSFSIYCANISRFFNPEDLSFVELYTLVNEEDI